MQWEITMFRALLILPAIVCLASANHQPIYRPCRLDHIDCIRAVLTDRSDCEDEGLKGAPNQYTLPYFRYEAPMFNSSYIEENLVTRNLNKCYFSEFYINHLTDSLVITLDCPYMEFVADRTLLQHYTGREDSVYRYRYRGTYPLVRYTTVVKNLTRLDFCNSFTYADVTQLPVFKIDPKDKPTSNFLTQDLSQLYIYERETFYCRGFEIFRRYLNTNICNTGCSGDNLCAYLGRRST